MNNLIKKEITTELIKKMNYPDFVGLMKQDNTPPGAEYTINYWIEHANITQSSILLDLACSTGYSSRTCYEKLKMKAVGVDISRIAIDTAQEKKLLLGANESLDYKVANACELPFESECFTHILGGCNYAFIDDRETALQESIRVLKNNGIICTSNFYYRKEPNTKIIDNVYKAIGFKPNSKWNLEFWRNFFNCGELELIHEKNHELSSQTDEELQSDILKYITNINEFTKSLDDELKMAFYEKFLSIRRPLNIQRDFQGVTIQLWRKK